MEQKQMQEWSVTKKMLNNCITDIITKCGAGLTITKSAKQREKCWSVKAADEGYCVSDIPTKWWSAQSSSPLQLTKISNTW